MEPISDLRRIQPRLPFNGTPAVHSGRISSNEQRNIKALIKRLHNIIRDHDSHSNIIERFDELTKILFLRLSSEESDPNLFRRRRNESETKYSNRIRDAYQELAVRNCQSIPARFAVMKSTRQTISQCGKELSQVRFTELSFDVKGYLYEEIIRKTFDKNENQQFFTPPTIVKFIVELMRPYISGSVCDPAAGTGGFLVEVIRSGVSYQTLTSIEIDQRLSWVTGINLLIHGAKNVSSHWLPEGGTLGRNAERFIGTFDTIITNPPFGSDFTDYSLLSTYALGRKRSSRRRGILFLERCYYLLKFGGVLGFIIDEGVLNGDSNCDVRKFLLDHFTIEAVTSLPETAFMPYANVSASILFLRKTLERKSTMMTFFAKAEHVGRKGNGDGDWIYKDGEAPFLNSDLPAISKAYRQYRQTEEVRDQSGTCFVTDVLNVRPNQENDLRLDYRFHHPTRRLTQERLDSSPWPLLRLSDVCTERKISVQPCRAMEDQLILYTGLAHIEARSGIAKQVPTPANSLKSSVKRYEPGDILFARLRPNLRKVAFMDFKEGGFVSPECIVLTVQNNQSGRPIIDPLLLSVLLRSDLVYGQVMHLIAGIGRPRLSIRNLKQILIPVADRNSQEWWKHRYVEEMSSVERMREKARGLFKEAEFTERESLHRLVRECVS